MADKNKPTLVPVALDGGWGWVVLFGAFFAYFIADGWSYSFGVFYIEILDYFNEGRGKTALIGALLYGVPMLLSPVVCALTSSYGCRPICMLGGLFLGFSFVTSAFATSVNFLCVSIGLFASIGLAMTYITALFSVTFYFEKRRGLATGLAVTGSGLGAFIFPPLMNYIEALYAWRGMLLLFGGICFNVMVAGALFRPPQMRVEEPDDFENNDASTDGTDTPKKDGTSKDGANEDLLVNQLEVPDVNQQDESDHKKQSSVRSLQFCSEFNMLVTSMLDKSLAYSWAYLLYSAANFILYLWAGVPYVYLIDYVTERGISHASFLLSIIAISRTCGQILLGFLGDQPKIDPNLIYACAVLVSGLATILVPFCDVYWSLAIYAVVFGFCISVTYTLQMVCLVRLVGLTRATSAFGLFQLVQGIAALLGTPVAGNKVNLKVL